MRTGHFKHNLYTSNHLRLHIINLAMRSSTPNPHRHKSAIPSLSQAKTPVEVSAVAEAQAEHSMASTPRWKRRLPNGKVPTTAKTRTTPEAKAQAGQFPDLAVAKVLVQQPVQTQAPLADPTRWRRP